MKELIDKICVQINYSISENYSSDENLRIPQIFYHSIGKNEEQYYKFIEKNLIQEDLFPNEVHKALLSFNPVSFVTTNFDDLLETAAIQYCQSYISIACDNEVVDINGDKYILKLHGDLKHKNIVFKEEDYLNYSENFKLMETLLKSIFSTNTVVFIGYGLNDYNIKLVLNWAKSLLKDRFNKPIFIYTDSSPLSEAELLYHNSRGLCVIDCTQITESNEGYLSRYMAVLNAIKKSADLSLDKKTPLEGFEILHQLLKPLNKLQALRMSDVAQKLSNYAIIDERGQILATLDNVSCKLFQCFYEISSMSSSEYNALDEDTRNKYHTILSVFEKAQIYHINWGNQIKCFAKNKAFSDVNCLHFDFATMRKIAFEVKADTKEDQYRKAFYLSRLEKYDESYFLFAEIAREAFKSKDYLLYYLCEVNCINLDKIIRNRNRYYGSYCIEDIDNKSPTVEKIEKIFEGLPIEFQNQYGNLKDLYSANLLYKYSYEAFVDGLKLQKAIESNATEFGLTSSQKVIYRINDYVHFLLGNGIVADVFSEYQNTVKNLMDLLVYKYSEQQKKIIHEQAFPAHFQDKVFFDDIDFYCFVEYFTGNEIARLFSKNQIESISFEKVEEIEKGIQNILCNYKYLESHKTSNIEIRSFQIRIKTLLVLLRYMDISQECVDSICEFILKREFWEISIDDKIIFLDRQIAKRKMKSDFTSRIIEEKLLQYLDDNIKAIKAGKPFSLMSTSRAVNYPNLVEYIYLPGEAKSNHAICLRVSHIMEKNLKDLIPAVVEHYWGYLSKYMKRKILRQVKNRLKNEFDFNLFRLLIGENVKIDANLIESLKNYLYVVLQKATEEENNKSAIVERSYPVSNPYDELELVGYWCLLKFLHKQDFVEFIGISDQFDFYVLYDQFDFTKFNVSWLINLRPHALDIISKNKRVKDKIRDSIATMLNAEKISQFDEIRLMKILTKYFC